MAKQMFRAFRVNHRSLTITHLGDYLTKDDADMAAYLDASDEPSPDKHLFHSWHVKEIYPSLARPKSQSQGT
jgi:hypothetical protein